MSVTERVRPLIVVEDDDGLERAERELRREGWRLSRGWRLGRPAWRPPDNRVVCMGAVECPEDASEALLAATHGTGLLAQVRPREALTARLVEDLTRLGPVDYRRCVDLDQPTVSEQERRILELIAEGLRVSEVARALHLSPRTVDRRLARARAVLDVASTAEAVARVTGRS